MGTPPVALARRGAASLRGARGRAATAERGGRRPRIRRRRPRPRTVAGRSATRRTAGARGCNGPKAFHAGGPAQKTGLPSAPREPILTWSWVDRGWLRSFISARDSLAFLVSRGSRFGSPRRARRNPGGCRAGQLFRVGVPSLLAPSPLAPQGLFHDPHAHSPPALQVRRHLPRSQRGAGGGSHLRLVGWPDPGLDQHRSLGADRLGALGRPAHAL